MTEKKKEENKTTAKIAKKAIATKKSKKVAPIAQNKDTLFSAEEIVQILDISSFEFYIVKNKFNIDNGALFTISQFKEMYNKAIGR